MEALRKPIINYLSLIIAVIIGTVLMLTSENSETAAMPMIIIPWIPLVFGLFTLLGYVLLRYLSPNWAWIVTFLGIASILFTTLKYYFIIY